MAGGGAQGISWPDDFCRALADDGFRVVRYDHRDTGRSTGGDHAQRPYDLTALAVDAAEVVRRLGAVDAHVVGQSMGGMLAQLLAVQEPEVVRSLALLSSSPDANGRVGKRPRTGLPGPGRAMLDHVATMAVAPPRTPEDRVAADVAGWRVLVGPQAPFGEAYWRDPVERSTRRAETPGASGYHVQALDRTPPLSPAVAGIGVPTLVVHGECDAVFPPEHGRALASAIPAARLVEIAGTGHIFPPEWSSRIIGLLREHLQEAVARGGSVVGP
ncbi:alpha/beta fold hydrolase [Kineosporia mesophila]|uniref:Alpha/beta fold hydrolase n=1 Tax=Kineosporia mesophila TaxID=566012 RepID=A0ABP6Z7Z2_9ACTN|nr:alpha/beta fold hydrolase [Kineosporia mesophila]